MILTGEQIVNAMNALVTIGTRQTCLIPSMAKFLLAKLHDELLPTYKELMRKQQELIQRHGEELFSDAEKTKPTGEWGIKDVTKKAEYDKAWEEIAKVELTFPLLIPIPVTMFGNDPRGLEMRDFVLLGPLVQDLGQVPKEPVQGELYNEVS